MFVKAEAKGLSRVIAPIAIFLGIACPRVRRKNDVEETGGGGRTVWQTKSNIDPCGTTERDRWAG